MATDWYKRLLKFAAWTWREYDWAHRRPRNKDRISSRNDKRSARQDEQREIEEERASPELVHK